MNARPFASNSVKPPVSKASSRTKSILLALFCATTIVISLGISLRATSSSASADRMAQKTIEDQMPKEAPKTSSAAVTTTAALPAATRSAPIDLALFKNLLDQHTQTTSDTVGIRVNYSALIDSAALDQLTRQIEAARPSKLNRNERLAFWINAYNILAIDLVRKNYPVNSIWDLGTSAAPVWDKTVVRVEGREITLGFIEHEILRKMNEPRVHATIVCASTSCPPLAQTPFRADHLDEDLGAAMRAWLSSPKKGIKINRPERQVSLSAIFGWFEADFEAAGGLLKFITPYVSDEQAAWLQKEGHHARIDHFDYDWTLNDFKQP